jgi:DNA polymerase-3 subunit gamma/tau
MDEAETSLGLGLDEPAQAARGAEAYRVLARKYRPQDFTGLIGQEALVRTLSNAFATGRIAHAFMLTGVRGVGKTTTARIIARALNCVGPDGTRHDPTIQPCGVCEPCVAIAESRHVDVQEMDAASRTGIDDVREIIEGVRYAPASARYKVYIIDEVHMLSKQAFNGLLKTLEEPPPHVKFVFATTEIRKVPVTVLSRCMRFDLRRIETPVLVAHLQAIAQKEKVEIDDAALALIARAAEGSVRDSLSLLDQVIAHEEGHAITADSVRGMLGLADRGRVLDLFEKLMGGDVAGALGDLAQLYDCGADPLQVMQDLLETTHFLTRVKVAPGAEGFFDGGSAEAARAAELANKLPVPALTRAWQMLLKGLLEVRDATRPIQAAEMALVRLAYAADLPPTDQLVRDLLDGGNLQTQSRPPLEGGPKSASAAPQISGRGIATAARYDPSPKNPSLRSDFSTLPQGEGELIPILFERTTADLCAIMRAENRIRTRAI